MDGKYSVDLFRDGGEGAGIEATLARHDDLATARALYRWHTLNNPGRLVMLRVRTRVLARSDRE
jgi:hypothetical protein